MIEPVKLNIWALIAPVAAVDEALIESPHTMIDSTWKMSEAAMQTCRTLPPPTTLADAPSEPVEPATDGVPLKERWPAAGRTAEPSAGAVSPESPI